MLVSSVIIVLREVLEAALLISVLLATSRRLHIGQRWLGIALAVGVAGAFAYSRLLAPVTELFDGVGQELTNAAMQLGVFVSLVIVVYQVVRRRADAGRDTRVLTAAMVTAVALASAQEGSEVIIYVSGFFRLEQFFSSVGIGSVAGAGIGFSIGVLFYYLLLALPERRSLWISLILLGFAAATMCIQATTLLIQADWLSAGRPLWDTSGWIGEGTLPGELLYALVGYEATPSPIEAGVYTAALVAIGLAAAAGWRRSPADRPGST